MHGLIVCSNVAAVVRDWTFLSVSLFISIYVSLSLYLYRDKEIETHR